MTSSLAYRPLLVLCLVVSSVVLGAQRERPDLGLLPPLEVKLHGWHYVVQHIAAGRPDGFSDWPSCGIALDRQARQAAVTLDSWLGFGPVGDNARARQAMTNGVACIEVLVPQAECTVKVFAAAAAGYNAVAVRNDGGSRVFESGLILPGFAIARARATTPDGAGCYLQMRNWGDARRMVVAWPPPA